MARDDDWSEERRWEDYREAQRRQDYGRDRSRYGYGDDNEPRVGYRAAREDVWFETRRREREDEARRRAHQEGHPYRPFGDTGPTAYGGAYYDSPYARGPGSMPHGAGAPYAGMGGYGAARTDYAPPRYDTGRFGGPPQDGRPSESRSFLDKAADQVASWFGDPSAERRGHEDELRASHRGRGPRSYKRSDARIQEDINDRLTEDAYLDATDIEVTVTGGEVVLSGIVPSREGKRRAERLAEEVSGVGDVQNNLRLRRSDAAETLSDTPPGGTM